MPVVEAPVSEAPLELVPVADLDDELLRRCYEQLLQPAFPASELVSLGELRDARSSGSTDGLVLLREGEPAGVVLTEDYLDGRVLLLCYLVVAEDLRSSGSGRRLLEEALRTRRPGALVLAEVDDPRCVPAGPHGDPVRRLLFYERFGARLLPLPYVQPSLRPGSPRVDGLLLITLLAGGDAVDGQLVAAFLDEYYEACEGAGVVADDPVYRSLRAAAVADGRLPLLAMSELDRARPSPDREAAED
jgi:GNAT superfamily N-acetyltransferase